MLMIKEKEQVKGVSIFDEVSNLGHEQVVFCHDEATGLKAIIAIHNTVLGPALGGTRMWDYASDNDAIIDVLRLSRGMTFKAAVSGLNLGGGKAVIIGDARKLKNEALLRRFGKFVESLNGKYITAEDVNMKTSDMEYIAMETDHVTGLPENMGGSGDPSPVTAYGTYLGMKATAKVVYGTDSLEGKKIGVQGMGQVGSHLVEYLVKEKANVYITDMFEAKVKEVASKYNVKSVAMDEIYDLEMDIYSPCALGATINDDTIDRLKCQAIAGAANNQLKDEKKHGEILINKGIAYAPDFVINAGGLMNVYAELTGATKEITFGRAEKIYTTTLEIFNTAKKEGITTQEAAIKLAMKRISDIGKINLGY
jgi:leucine dehydrogenase